MLVRLTIVKHIHRKDMMAGEDEHRMTVGKS